MAIEILMPALSPTMTEGNLAKWHVKVGDRVNPGDLIAEIETDKATMEVEAVDEGVLGSILVDEGSNGVPVNEVIGLLLEDGEDTPPAPLVETPAPVSPTDQDDKVAPDDTGQGRVTPLAERMARQLRIDLGEIPGTGPRGKIMKADIDAYASRQADPETEPATTRLRASPLARRMAADSGIDLASVAGSGPNDRIVKRDVEASIAAAPPSPTVPAPTVIHSAELVRLSTMRRVIAQRMTESKTQVPHFYLTIDCQVDELMAARKSLNERREDVRISVNDFVIRACGLALMDVPEANVAYENENEMRQFRTADISVAVAINGGLITPVLQGVERKGLKQVSEEMRGLSARAREGKLLPEEYQGGSFSHFQSRNVWSHAV